MPRYFIYGNNGKLIQKNVVRRSDEQINNIFGKLSMSQCFPHYQQLDSMDCGPSCLRMIAKFYGRSYSLQNLRERCFITRQGVSMLGISDAAESIGLRTQGVRIGWEQLIEAAPLPCILHWNQNHFVVLYAIKRRSVFSRRKKYNINLVFQIRLKVNTKLIKSDLRNVGLVLEREVKIPA